MKKIIVGIISFVFIFSSFISAKEVFASSVWNGASNDCKTVSIANHTTGDGHEDPCWPLSSLQAEAGDTINVRIYYHNTSTQKATNVKILLDAPTGTTGSTQKFTGRITSDQGSVSGTVTAYIPSAQKLSFGSTKWYPNQKSTNSSLLSGQSGKEVLSGGLYIGDIASGWSTQGSVVVSFKVSNDSIVELCKDTNANNYGKALPCTYDIKNPTGTISASPSSCTISQGNSTCSSTLTWTTQNPVGTSAVTKSGATVATSNNGTKTVPVSYGSSTYYLYNNGTQLDSVSVNASCASGTDWNGSYCEKEIIISNPTGTISASPSSCTISQGNSTCSSTLTWTTQNPVGTSAVTKSGATVATSNNGTKTVPVSYGSSTYYLYNNGTQLDSVSVNASCASGTDWNGSYCEKETVPTYSCSIISFEADETTVTTGESVTLSWETENCTYVNISGVGSNLASSGSKTVYPTKTTTYNLSAIKSGSTTQTRSLVVNVNNSSNYVCSINSFSVNESSVVVGDSVTFSWSTENCTSVNISNIGTNLPSAGEKTIYPTKTTTYTLTGNTSSGTKPTRSLSVSVSDSANYICSIVNFGANDTSVTEGDAVTISWSTENCTSVNISNIGTNLPSVGEKTIYPTKTTTYTLTGNTSSGTKPTRSLKINVSATPEYECSIVDFYAEDTSIEDGDKAVLVWNVEDCDYISISGIGTVSSSGSKSVYPSSDKTYTLTAYDSGKTKQTKNVKIYVDDDNNDDDDSDYCEIDSFTSSSSSISKGDGVTLKWRTTGCEDLSISNIGDVDEDDSYKVYPRVTTTYVLRAYGEDGDKETESLTIRVKDSEEQTVYNVGTVTTIATGLTQNSASLNGLITGSTSSINSNAYFEYGTTTALGNRTKSTQVSGNANFSEYVSGLAPNTIYYFRAVSDNSGGTAYGAIQTFRTLGYNYNYNNNYTNTTTEVIRQVVVGGGTTVYGENSPVMLSIENRYEYLGRKDYIDYTVLYKNIGKATLEDVVLQVVVPEGIFITNASEGTYSNDTHILSVELDDLIPGEDGVVYLEARVDSLPDNLAKIVSSAVLVYTNKNGAQENAIAYVLNMPKTNANNLGASAFFSGFWGFGLIGWLLIILLILLIILIARSIYQKRVSSEQNNN